MKVVLHPEASAEYADAARFYGRRDERVATRFVDAIEDALARIGESPRSWPAIRHDVRWCLARSFPYAVLFVIEPDRAHVLAIMHCSREPGYWQERTRTG